MNAPMDRTSRTVASLLVVALAAGIVAGVGGCAAIDRVKGLAGGSSTSTAPWNGATARLAPSPSAAPGYSTSAGASTSMRLSADSAAQSAVAMGGSATTVAQGSTAAGVVRLVVRDSTLRLRVKDVAGSAKKIALLTGASGGYVESMQLASDTGGTVTAPQPVPMAGTGVTRQQGVPSSGATALSGYVRVRVPAEKLAVFTRDVSGLGEVVYQATDAQDVTAQHVDMVARLKNLQASEADLRRLAARANTVGEVLAVERELTRVQGEIESLQAQIALLENQATLAAVTVQLVGPEAIVTPVGDSWGFTDALRTSVRAFVGTINVLIVALGALLPIIAIFALLAWLIWWLVRRSGRRNAARLAAEATAAEEASSEPTDAGVVPSEPDAGDAGAPDEESSAQ